MDQKHGGGGGVVGDVASSHNVSFGMACLAKEISRILGEQWKVMDNSAKAYYRKLEAQDRARLQQVRTIACVPILLI